jgi:hypothetical protein
MTNDNNITQDNSKHYTLSIIKHTDVLTTTLKEFKLTANDDVVAFCTKELKHEEVINLSLVVAKDGVSILSYEAYLNTKALAEYYYEVARAFLAQRNYFGHESIECINKVLKLAPELIIEAISSKKKKDNSKE